MLTLVLLISTLAAGPLNVRVLERQGLDRVSFTASKAACDGTAIQTTQGTVAVEKGQVAVDGRPCVEVVLDSPTFTFSSETRAYPGDVHLSVEGSALRFINRADVEAYLPSVVHAEMGDAKAAALQAQAVVSRTFALGSGQRHKKYGYDLCDLTHCQVYRGTAASEAARSAVKATEGALLWVGGVKLLPAYFHASCGGHTSLSIDVFGESASGSAVADTDMDPWEFSVSKAELARALGHKNEGAPFESLRRDSAGRHLELRTFGQRYSGNVFLAKVTRALGFSTLKSLKFSTRVIEETVEFRGTGRGHGVGFCQVGGRAAAVAGAGTEAILKRYFPESVVRRR